MELKSFREILLKKADGNPYLQTLIKYAKDEIIAEEVMEALLKMAEPSAAMGRGANHAVTSYAAGLGEPEVDQLRSALGHHVSRYQGALKAHHAATDPKEKQNFRNVADKHLNRIVPLMHLAGKASKHSGGNLTIDYPSMTPWETNYTTTERLPNGKLKEGTKDLGRRPMGYKVHDVASRTEEARNTIREKNPRSVPDYRYLEMPPHPGHATSDKMPHKGGYPFEEVQVGSPGKRDTGQAYLPIEDVKDVNEYVPHPFDAHPVHHHADTPHHELGPEHEEAIKSGLAGWDSSPHHQQYLKDEENRAMADPEAYENAGKKKPGHVYEGIPLDRMKHHDEAAFNQATPVSSDIQPQLDAPQSTQPKQTILKKPAKKKEDDDAAYNRFMSSLSAEQKADMEKNPDFKALLDRNKK